MIRGVKLVQQICGIKAGNKTHEKNNANCYYIQLRCFRKYNAALDYQLSLIYREISAEIDRKGSWYCVRTGCIASLDEAVSYEKFLKFRGYDTFLIS